MPLPIGDFSWASTEELALLRAVYGKISRQVYSEAGLENIPSITEAFGENTGFYLDVDLGMLTAQH